MSSEESRFYTGYYNKAEHSSHHEMAKCLGKVAFGDIEYAEDDRMPCPYTCAYDFLQGSCQLFSLALHQMFGYDAFEIWSGKSCHCFCIAVFKGKTVYIDLGF